MWTSRAAPTTGSQDTPDCPIPNVHAHPMTDDHVATEECWPRGSDLRTPHQGYASPPSIRAGGPTVIRLLLTSGRGTGECRIALARTLEGLAPRPCLGHCLLEGHGAEAFAAVRSTRKPACLCGPPERRSLRGKRRSSHCQSATGGSSGSDARDGF